MKVYAINDATLTAISVGHIKWFDTLDVQLPSLTEVEVLQVCRPCDSRKVGAFDAYIAMLKQNGPIYFSIAI